MNHIPKQGAGKPAADAVTRTMRGVARPWSRVFARLLVLLSVLLMVSAVVALLGWLLWLHLVDGHDHDAVAQVEPAGQVQAVTLGGCLTHSLVQTDLGFYALGGAAILLKGQDLTLETRANRMRFLCDPAHRCVRLL